LKVGVHVSISGSIDQAVDRAKEEGCDTFQVFTRNPRGWKFAELDPEEVKSFREKLAQSTLGPVVDHMPYLPNLSCPEDELYEKSTATLLAEVDRCGTLGISYLVVHLGSHLGMGRDVGLQRITDALNVAVKRVKKDPWILLENMAGQGTGLDRHEHIGMGYIGAKGFKAILHHETIKDLPWILETPEDERRDDKGNLETVRKLAK